MQGIYTYIPETNYVPREYSVAAIVLLLFMVLISLVSVLNLLYFYISTFRSMCTVPSMAVFWSSLTSCFPGMLLTYLLLLLLLLLLLTPMYVAVYVHFVTSITLNRPLSHKSALNVTFPHFFSLCTFVRCSTVAVLLVFRHNLFLFVCLPVADTRPAVCQAHKQINRK